MHLSHSTTAALNKKYPTVPLLPFLGSSESKRSGLREEHLAASRVPPFVSVNRLFRDPCIISEASNDAHLQMQRAELSVLAKQTYCHCPKRWASGVSRVDTQKSMGRRPVPSVALTPPMIMVAGSYPPNSYVHFLKYMDSCNTGCLLTVRMLSTFKTISRLGKEWENSYETHGAPQYSLAQSPHVL